MSLSGRDVFVVLLENIVRAKEISPVAEKIFRIVSDPCPLVDPDVTITCSLGISVFPTDGEDVENLLKNADQVLYSAKEYISVLHTWVETRSQERCELKNQLCELVEKGVSHGGARTSTGSVC